jgi:hypothetical protein
MPSYNRQLDDEAAQKAARAADEDRDAEELKSRGYNII